MSKTKSKFTKINSMSDETTPNKDTLELLKRAWNDLPPDFTMGERSLFIEIAEKLVKVAEENDQKFN